MNAARMISASNIVIFVLCLLIILLPFNALINTFFSEKIGIDLFKFWKEGLFGILCLGFLFKRPFKLPKIDKFWWVGLSFFVLVVGYTAFVSGFMDFFRVMRLELLPILGIFVFWLVGNNLDEKDKTKLMHLGIGATFVSVLISLFLMIGYGNEILVKIGYRMDWSTFYAGEALAFCQKIENSELCRFQGFLSGPNQMGIYMVLMLATGLVYLRQHLLKWTWVLFCMSIIALTFSRSSMLAAIVMLFSYFVWNHKDWIIKHKIKVFMGILIGVIASLGLFFDEIIMFFDRPESNSERLKLMKEGLNVWKENFIFGAGAGEVGPNSRVMAETAIIPENWFLQVAGQFGLVGLGLFGGWYLGLIQNLLSKKAWGAGLLMLAILIPLNLLHSFEAASFVYALSIFVGFSLNET
jgi:hypothetical protein